MVLGFGISDALTDLSVLHRYLELCLHGCVYYHSQNYFIIITIIITIIIIIIIIIISCYYILQLKSAFALYRMILSVLDPRKCEYLKHYSLDFEHAYMTTYLA